MTSPLKISALLLAAGSSQRFGVTPKQLAELQPKIPMVAQTYQALCETSIDTIIIVTGRETEEIKSILDLRNKDDIVYNPRFEKGMTSSIQTGLAQITYADGLMIALADMPALTSLDYEFMIQAFDKKGGVQRILLPIYKGQRGNPVIFGNAFFKDIANHQAPNGCYDIIQKNKKNLIKIDVPNDHYLVDIDTREDLKNFMNRAE